MNRTYTVNRLGTLHGKDMWFPVLEAETEYESAREAEAAARKASEDGSTVEVWCEGPGLYGVNVESRWVRGEKVPTC